MFSLMKTKNQTRFDTPESGIFVNPGHGAEVAPAPMPGTAPPATRTAPKPPAQTRTKTRQRPAYANMILANQAGLVERNPPWEHVEEVVRELDPGFGNSHCLLEIPGPTYIQTLRGFQGYHLEWRITGARPDQYVHFRACHIGGSEKSVELKKHDCMNQGEHRDLIALPDVIDAFRAFHRGQNPPAWLEWREIEV
jgi:hypothetical protein